jgi:geranylgeranyl diphosphate synthase, type II
MFTSEELLVKVKEAINNLDFRGEPDELYSPIAYTMADGGKRIRPVLTLLTCDMLGGDLKKAIYPAISLEIFHNFTLVHDDIMDNAPIRRGKETVYRKWNSNIAILSGDTMFALAYKYLIQTDRNFLPSIIEIFTDAAIGVCEGQQLDMNYENYPDVSIEDYIKMIRLKTAVLLAASIKTGATISGVENSTSQTLYDFGINLGIAFQLQDDLLDVYGNQDTFGKQIGGDIAINKKTYLIIKALELSNETDRQELKTLFSSVDWNREEKFTKVIGIYNKYGIKEITTSAINQYYSEALKHLAVIAVPEQNKSVFKKYTDKMMMRPF